MKTLGNHVRYVSRVLMVLSVVAGAMTAAMYAQSPQAVISGPVGPSPYDVVRSWHQPFSKPGFAFGGNSGVFAETPDRILVAQRGEFRLPDPVPSGFLGFAGSIGFNVLSVTDRRVWQNCLYSLDSKGKTIEVWNQWDKLFEGSSGPGPHRIRVNFYDPQHKIWVINETFSEIYVFSNDMKTLVRTLGEKNVEGTDGKHFGKPQDVAFLPDGRVLIADGLDNHRVMIMDKELNYLGEVGGKGTGPGQFNGVHAVGVGPDGRVFALDRSGGRINVFKTSSNPKTLDFVTAFPGFSLPLDILVNDDAIWVTDLNPLRFNKLDFQGNHLYTWMVPKELPDGYLEVHTFTVDSGGTLYGGDNQYGRTQKFTPKAGADPKLLIRAPWRAKQ